MTKVNGKASRDVFFATCKREYSDVNIARLGTVRLRTISERERSVMQIAATEGKGTPAERASLFKAHLIASCVVDPENNLMFSLENGDLDKLQDMDTRVATALGSAIIDFCGLADEAIEEAEKN